MKANIRNALIAAIHAKLDLLKELIGDEFCADDEEFLDHEIIHFCPSAYEQMTTSDREEIKKTLLRIIK